MHFLDTIIADDRNFVEALEYWFTKLTSGAWKAVVQPEDDFEFTVEAETRMFEREVRFKRVFSIPMLESAAREEPSDALKVLLSELLRLAQSAEQRAIENATEEELLAEAERSKQAIEDLKAAARGVN